MPTVRRNADFAQAADRLIDGCEEKNKAKLERLLLGGKLKHTRDKVPQLAKEKADRRRQLVAEIVATGAWPEQAKKPTQHAEQTQNHDAPAYRDEDDAASGNDLEATSAPSVDGVPVARGGANDDASDDEAALQSPGPVEDAAAACHHQIPQATAAPAGGGDVKAFASPDAAPSLGAILDGTPVEAADLLIRLRGTEWALALGRTLVERLGQSPR